MRVALRRGDIAASSASVLVTSANDSLVGNLSPMYWRFISRTNVDSSIRKLGGPELVQACLHIDPRPTEGVRRDITRWTSGVKHGPSAVVRCPAGSAVSTRASGALQADWVVHAVAPDSEFGYEGMYTGGMISQEASGLDPELDGFYGKYTQQFSPPDRLLLAAYENTIAEASRLQASSVCCPGLGVGVKGWRPAISAALGLEATAQCARGGGGGISSLEFVVGGVNADAPWRDWLRVARTLLGAPSGLERDEDFKEQAARGELCWELPLGGALSGAVTPTPAADERHPSMAGLLLPLEELPEVREMLYNRERGYSGMDEPLTPEQELAATRRRTTR